MNVAGLQGSNHTNPINPPMASQTECDLLNFKFTSILQSIKHATNIAQYSHFKKVQQSWACCIYTS